MKHNQSIFVAFIFCIIVLFIGCSEDDSRDILSKATVSFSDETYRIVESSSDDIRIPIGLDTPYHNGGTVDVTVTGGVLGEDYIIDQPSNTFTISFSEVSVLEFFTITPIDDNRLNKDVELEITLSNPTGNLKLGLVSFLQVILLDDEERLTAEVNFELEEYEVNENETIEIPINFNNLSTEGGTITIVAGGGDAVYGEDYVLDGANEDGEVTLTVEEYGNTATLSITALDNDLFEENKTFQIQILEVTGGIEIAQENSIAEVTIIEDDASPFTTIGFSSNTTTSASENASEVTIELALSQTLNTNEMVSINVGSASTAVLGEDFSFENGSTTNPLILNLEAGSDSATFTIELTDDDSEEDDESIEFSLTTDSQTLEIDDNNSSLTFSIEDNDGDNSGGGDAPVYLETFENSQPESTLQDPYGYVTESLSNTSVANSETALYILNNADGKFSDVENVASTSDWGPQLGYVNKADDTNSSGQIDNVLISPSIPADGSNAFQLIYDIGYSKPNSTSMVEVYFSENSDGSSFSSGDWNLVDTVDEANIGVGRNEFARRTISINTSNDFYIAFRTKATIDEAGSDNEGTRWRLDNIKVLNDN